MKVIPFETFEHLFNEIQQDKKSNNHVHNRFPVRFIFLPDFDSMQILWKKLIDTFGCSTFNLIDLLPWDDGWVSHEEMNTSIRKLIDDKNTKDFIIYPVSEIARFYSDNELTSVFVNLCEIQTKLNIHQRFYIPLVGMHERFQDFLKHFSREWGPIWVLNIPIESKLKVTMCVDIDNCMIDHSPQNKMRKIEKTKGWLELWNIPKEKLFSKEILCHSETLSTLYHNSRPDSFYTFYPIENQKETILMLHGLDLPIEWIEEEKHYWDWLMKFLEKFPQGQVLSFDNIISQMFNVQIVDINDILSLWFKTSSESERWLLKNYGIHTYESKGYYLIEALNQVKNYTEIEFEKSLWLHIFSQKRITRNIIEERRNLLNDLYNQSGRSCEGIEGIIKKELDIYYKSCDKCKDKMLILTGITNVEKCLILELTQTALLNNELNRAELLEIYEFVFPSLYKYLDTIIPDNISPDNSWVGEYFEEYRWSKVFNRKTERLETLLKEKNLNITHFFEWYHSIDTTNKIIDNSEKTNIVWIDALGFEWCNLLYHTIAECSTIEKIELAKSIIPTTTDMNRIDIEKAGHILDLDKFIHTESSYKFPISFIKEIELIVNLAKNKSSLVDSTTIVSDHGLSAFVRKAHGTEKKYGFNPEHDGRCMWTDKKIDSDSDYILIDAPTNSNKGKYIIVALGHNTLGNVPCREVHGGATPEEVIVPVISISPTKKQEINKYIIEPKSIDVDQRNPLFDSITINPKPHRASIKYNNQEWRLVYNSDMEKWSVLFRGLKPGEYKCKVKIEGSYSSEIKIVVTGGMKVRDLI